MWSLGGGSAMHLISRYDVPFRKPSAEIGRAHV